MFYLRVHFGHGSWRFLVLGEEFPKSDDRMNSTSIGVLGRSVLKDALDISVILGCTAVSSHLTGMSPVHSFEWSLSHLSNEAMHSSSIFLELKLKHCF